MSDTLKTIYREANLAHSFWDDATPVDLWRVQKKPDFDRKTMLFEPHPGNDTRPADVRVIDRDGHQVVLGCRCVKGGSRGISTFDKRVTWFGNRSSRHFRLPAKAILPPGIAVTKDHRNEYGAHHYTLAPKDDMPLDLFLQHLRSLAQIAILEN
jgi:hypothetical protein